MMINELKTYSTSSISAPFLSTVADTASTSIWIDRIPAKTDIPVFLSPELRSEEALAPNDKIWDEVDAMLVSTWATDESTSQDQETEICNEIADIMHISESIRFERLYGESNDWE